MKTILSVTTVVSVFILLTHDVFRVILFAERRHLIGLDFSTGIEMVVL